MYLGLGLALTRQRGPGTAAAPAIVMNPLPATLEGSIGNTATWPQAVRMKGPHADKYAIGPVLGTATVGDQVVRIYDAATGTLLETQIIRAGGVEDDHNTVAIAARSDGTLEVAASGHNTTPNLVVATRSPAGVWSIGSLSFSDVLTYPNLYLDQNEKLHLIIRTGNIDWCMRTKATAGGSWTAEKTFLTALQQSYTAPNFLPGSQQILFSARFNNSDPGAGPIRLMRYDCATGEFFDENGGLGFLSGSASANTKTLPVTLENLPTFLSNDVGRVVGVSDMDDSYIVVVDDVTDGTYDTKLKVFKYNSGNRLSLASYTQGPVFTNQKGRMSSTSNYRLGAVLATEAHTGFRAYITRGVAGRLWYFAQWDNTGDIASLSDYKTKNLSKSAGVGVLARGITLQDAQAGDPVLISSYTTFTDFNNYGTATVVFVEPWRGGTWPVIAPGYTMRAETQAWIARMSVQPNEYWAKFIYDPFVGELIDANIWDFKDFEYFLGAHDIQASLLNLKSSNFTATQALGLPNSAFKAGIGWTGDGVGHLDTGFNTSTASPKLMTQNSCHVSILGVGPGTSLRGAGDASQSDVIEAGNANTQVTLRSTSNTCIVRINSTTSDGLTNNVQAAFAFASSRSASTGINSTVGGTTSGTARTSAAPSNANVWLLGCNGQAGKSTRTLGGFGMGSDIDATKRLAMINAYANAQNAILEYLGPNP